MREDENFKKNKEIVDAIHVDKGDHNEKNWQNVLSMILKRMHENSTFLVPIIAEQNGDKINQISYRIIKGAEDQPMLPVFTDLEEMKKKEPVNVAAIPMREILATFLNGLGDVAFLVINPWGEPFPVSKKVAEYLLDADNKIAMRQRGMFLNPGDITKVQCEAIVNSADPLFDDGGGVDHAIYEAAGDGLMKVLDAIGSCKIGEVKATPAFELPQRWILHTVGPVFSGEEQDKEFLAKCYVNCLDEAKKHRIRSIAFPAISCGASGYPVEQAAQVAIVSVMEWLNANPDYAISVIFDAYDEKTENVYKALLTQVQKSVQEKAEARAKEEAEKASTESAE